MVGGGGMGMDLEEIGNLNVREDRMLDSGRKSAELENRIAISDENNGGGRLRIGKKEIEARKNAFLGKITAMRNLLQKSSHAGVYNRHGKSPGWLNCEKIDLRRHFKRLGGRELRYPRE